MVEPDWLCPLCALVRMKYGTTCPKFADVSCEHMDKVHITGQYYLKKTESSEEGTGISRISDE